MRWPIRVLLPGACVIIAFLCLSLVDGWIPRILGSATLPVLAFVLGGLIYRDVIRRDRRDGLLNRSDAGRATR
jgi:hypothetical protein